MMRIAVLAVALLLSVVPAVLADTMTFAVLLIRGSDSAPMSGHFCYFHNTADGGDSTNDFFIETGSNGAAATQLTIGDDYEMWWDVLSPAYTSPTATLSHPCSYTVPNSNGGWAMFVWYPGY